MQCFFVVDGAINNKYVKELQKYIQKGKRQQAKNKADTYDKTFSSPYHLEHQIQLPISKHRIRNFTKLICLFVTVIFFKQHL